MERHVEIQRPLVCAARRMTKALPPDISLYLSQATSFHPLLITPFSCSVSLCLLPSLFSFLFLLLLPNIPSLPSFHAALSLLLLVIFAPFKHPLPILCLPSPSTHLQTSHPAVPPCLLTIPAIHYHIMWNQSASRLLCIPPRWASRLPCFLPSVL